MGFHSNCRLCHKPITLRGNHAEPYSEHIAEQHPEVRRWLRQEMMASKEKINFAWRAAHDIPPEGEV